MTVEDLTKEYEFKIESELEDCVSERLDSFLAQQDSLDISRSYIKTLIKNGQVLVNNKAEKPSYKLKIGDLVSLDLPEPEDTSVEPEAIPLDIVYEDKDLIVINKPIDMVTHPAPGVYSGTLVNAVLHHCKNSDGSTSLSGINGVLRPGIVHRLDKDTSGLILVAKTDEAHKSLQEQIQNRTLERRYQALVYGRLKDQKGVVEKPIARHPKHRYKMAVLDSNLNSQARYAKTNYKVLETYEYANQNFSLVECKLDTGRTHQIRVHMAYIHHPILGDWTYGTAKKKNPLGIRRPLLHSYKISFEHPKTAERLSFEIPLAGDFREALDILKV